MCTEHHYWHHDYVRLAYDSGFCFDSLKSKSNLDRSSLSIIDIDTVIKDRDVAVIEKHLNAVTNYYLEPEHTKILDPIFVKVFRLSQLSVEYLQFCKRYLDNTVVVVKKELAKQKEENNDLKNYVEVLKSEINDLKDKVKTLKESLQQSNLETTPIYKCPTCLKSFVTEEFLLSHIKRRHESISFQTETDKLQLEIKELKERLNTTEKYIQSDHNLKQPENIPDNNQVVNKDQLERVDLLLTKFEELKQFVERELSLLKAEKCNDKYERWLEIVFKRLDSSKKELQSEQYGEGDVLSTGDGFSERKKSDNVTQTGIIVYRDIEVMTEQLEEVEIVNKPGISEILEDDIKKIQQQLYVNTENHLGQIQNVLEEKLTGGLEQIQTQINTFYQKLNTIEAQRLVQVKEYNSPVKQIQQSNFQVEETRPQPLPRVTKSLPIVKQTQKPTSKGSVAKLETKPFAKTALCGLSSEASSFSSISDDEKILLPKSSKENIKPDMVPKKDSKKSLVVKTLYDKNLKIGTTFCESGDTEEEEDKVPVKPSTSTLGRRSLSSLKQVGKDKQVLEGLKNELEEMLCLRLKGVGVSPTWKRLPRKSYLKAMGIIQHQMDLTTKKYPEYYKIQANLIKKIEKAIKKTPKKSITIKPQQERHQRHETVPKKSKHSSQSKKVAFDSDESSSNRSSVAAAKEIQETDGVESKMGKKKVLFDLEEIRSGNQNDKLLIENKIQLVKGKEKIAGITENVELLSQQNDDDSSDLSESDSSFKIGGNKQRNEKSTSKDEKKIVKEEISDWEISDI